MWPILLADSHIELFLFFFTEITKEVRLVLDMAYFVVFYHLFFFKQPFKSFSQSHCNVVEGGFVQFFVFLQIILLPCGHVCLCEDCSDNINDSCPICREEIVSKAPAFIT